MKINKLLYWTIKIGFTILNKKQGLVYCKAIHLISSLTILTQPLFILLAMKPIALSDTNSTSQSFNQSVIQPVSHSISHSFK